MGAALQVFHNLGELNAAVDAQISSLASEAVDAIRDALDPRALSREMGGGGGGGLGGGRWIDASACPRGPGTRVGGGSVDRLGAAMDVARARGMSAWHLQRVLAKKRDPITHALFLDETTREKGETSDTTDRPRGAPDALRALRPRVQQGRGRGVQRAHAGAGCEGRVVGRVPASRALRGDARRSREGERRVRAERGVPRGAPRRF